MGQALPLCVRERIIKLQREGFLLTEIKKELSLPYSTVQQIIKRYRTKGLSGLQADYAKCGGKGQLRNLYFYYRASLWLKRHHLNWGAPLIHLILVERYGQADIPSIRQMQRWFKDTGLNVPRQKKGDAHDQQVHEVHERWQVDAKEQLTLQDNQLCTYLSIVDEFSGTSLGATLFPLRSNMSSAS